MAIPLVLTTASWTLQHFVDRMFLTWYSPEAIAAVLPAGMLSFALLSVFLGTVGYTSTFVAQYHGADRHREIGAILGCSVGAVKVRVFRAIMSLKQVYAELEG